MLIRVKKLSVEYKNIDVRFFALKDISIDINEGDWFSLLGPSGSGKSTLLNAISGLLKPSNGEIIFNDRNLYKIKPNELQAFRRKNIGYIFQDFRLLPQYSVFDNISIPLIPYENKKVIKERATELIHEMGLSHRVTHLPHELSGGEKQRVAIARALMYQPQLLICDEPTGNLDVDNRNNILSVFQTLQQKGHTIIMATHDPEVAMYGQKSLYLKNGQIESVVEV